MGQIQVGCLGSINHRSTTHGNECIRILFLYKKDGIVDADVGGFDSDVFVDDKRDFGSFKGLDDRLEW